MIIGRDKFLRQIKAIVLIIDDKEKPEPVSASESFT